MINHDPHKKKMETNQFFNNIKIIELNNIPKINLIITHKVIFHQMKKNTKTKIINSFPQTTDLVFTGLINQIFLKPTQENNK